MYVRLGKQHFAHDFCIVNLEGIDNLRGGSEGRQGLESFKIQKECGYALLKCTFVLHRTRFFTSTATKFLLCLVYLIEK